MTVQELENFLSEFSPNTPVFIRQVQWPDQYEGTSVTTSYHEVSHGRPTGFCVLDVGRHLDLGKVRE